MRMGLAASVAAFLIIEYLLVTVYLDGVYAPFKGFNLLLISSLIPIGLAAYIGYLRWMVYGRNIFKYASALALALGLLAIILGYIGSGMSLPILVLAYFTEVVVGPYLMKGFDEISPLSAKLFVLGIAGFVFTLPLVSLNNQFAVIPFMFNLVKGLSLSHLLILSSSKASGVETLQASQILRRASPPP